MTVEVPGRLPDRVRTWAQTHAPQPILQVVTLPGGITSTKWLLRLVGGEQLVLRWADPQVWGAVGREHVRREALACRLLACSPLPVPRLLASDEDGSAAGGPANLLTWLAGGVRLDWLGPDAIESLARLAVAVHEQPVVAEHQPPVFTFRGPTEPQVPTWARWPSHWQRAIDLWTAGAPPTPYGLLHRDFHLGNVVWHGDQVTGLVDWAETSWGPPDLDVAHAGADFAMLHSLVDVQTFRAAYLRQGGRLDPDPEAARFWVIADILGFLPDPAHILASVGPARPDLSADAIRRGLEDLLVATLG